MPTYAERSFRGHYRSAYPVSLVSGILDKGHHAFMSLFSPEDTTANKVGGELPIAGHSAYNINGLTKTILWVAISISIALLMGRLS